jgi:hypothetical protein
MRAVSADLLVDRVIANEEDGIWRIMVALFGFIIGGHG